MGALVLFGEVLLPLQLLHQKCSPSKKIARAEICFPQPSQVSKGAAGEASMETEPGRSSVPARDFSPDNRRFIYLRRVSDRRFEAA